MEGGTTLGEILCSTQLLKAQEPCPLSHVTVLPQHEQWLRGTSKGLRNAYLYFEAWPQNKGSVHLPTKFVPEYKRWLL